MKTAIFNLLLVGWLIALVMLLVTIGLDRAGQTRRAPEQR